MEAKALQALFIKMLCAELNDNALAPLAKEQLTPDAIAGLYVLSKRQDLAHVVAACLRRNQVAAAGEAGTKFSREEMLSIYRYEQMRHTYGLICDILEAAAIPYIPLKGSVLRPYYPKETMRTSCDIDILVREENLDAAVQALVQKGFRSEKKAYHDISLYSPNNVHLELHFSIQENRDDLDAVLKDAWLYAVPIEGCQYGFSQEFFLFHMYAHMAYHFLGGGCGVRPLMDIWVMEHRMGIDWQQARGLLEKAGICTFAQEIHQLAEACFSGQPKDSFSDTLLGYIFDGGVYGSAENRIAVRKEEQGTFRYLLRRLFMPYRDMKVQFPVLKKCPLLLPFCWVIRIFRMLFKGKTGASIAEIRTANQVSDQELDQIKKIKEKLGL